MKEIIKAEIERMIDSCKTKNGFPAGTYSAIRIETLERVLAFIDSMQETDAPVFPSEQEVQKASEQYADGMWLSGSSWADAARKTFLAGANWMKYHID